MYALSLSRLTLLVAIGVPLSGCSSFDGASGKIAGFVSPYKIEVVQGNFVSKEQRAALQNGMPRAQVRDILGSPLVTSTFHADRWDYVFTIRRQGQEPQLRRLSVFFKGDELSKIEHDELVSEQDFVDSLSRGRVSGKVPILEVPESQLPAPVATPSGANVPANTVRETRVYPPLEAPQR